MALTIPKAIRKLLIKEPFYGLFLLSLNKYFDDKVPTACVKRNGINVELAINEKFWNSLSDEKMKPFIEKAEADKKRFEAEEKEYYAKIKAKQTKSDKK